MQLRNFYDVLQQRRVSDEQELPPQAITSRVLQTDRQPHSDIMEVTTASTDGGGVCLPGELAGHAAKMLIDSGASGNIIANKFAQVHGLQRRREVNAEVTAIKLADGSLVDGTWRVSAVVESATGTSSPWTWTVTTQY